LDDVWRTIRDEYVMVTGKTGDREDLVTGKTIPANRAVEAIFGFFQREVTAKSGRSARFRF
jgi:hypothetical protein